MSSSVLLPSSVLRSARRFKPLAALGIALAVILLWALWAVYFNTAQFGDNIEQFNWAQSLELGYHKHPPLPSWLLGAVIKLFGASIYWAYVLATLCLLGTATFTWLIGHELVGDRVASAAVLLWGLNMTFSQRVQLYNHNTVLVLWLAAAVWCAMRASRAERHAPLWWLATGLAAGAATLSKYQAFVPLAGLLLALGLSGRLRRAPQWQGAAFAVVVMLVLCAPHAVWVAKHDFSTLRYASEAVESSGLRQRIGFIVSFVANQVRLWSPALLAMALCWGWTRVSPAVTASTEGTSSEISNETFPESSAKRSTETSTEFQAWMLGLVWAGVAVLGLMALGAGVSLRNHWGVQALQFFAIWLAWRWDRRSPIDLKRLVCAALAVHAASLAWYASEHQDPTTVLTSRRIDTMYPARRLARAAVAHWSAATGCPLHYVAGTVFDAGLVSLYSGGSLEVFDTESATPWVKREDLRREGALYVFEDDDAVPANVTNVVVFELVLGDRHGLPPKTLKLGVQLPAAPCPSAGY